MRSFDKDDVENVLKYYQCAICAGLLQETVVCEMGHFFCSFCLSKHLKSSTVCPKNNYHSLDTKHLKRTKQVDEIIETLVINCKNRQEGCYWKGKMKYFNLHLTEECRYGIDKPEDEPEENKAFLYKDEGSQKPEEDSEIEEEDLNFDDELAESEKSEPKPEKKKVKETERKEEEDWLQDSLSDDFIKQELKKEDEAALKENSFVKEFQERLRQLADDEPSEGLLENFTQLKEFMFTRFDEFHTHLDKLFPVSWQNPTENKEIERKRVVPCLIGHESIKYEHRSIELTAVAEKKAPYIVLNLPTSEGSFVIEFQVFSKLRKGWIGLGLCEAEVARSHNCEFHKNDYEGYALFTTNGFVFNGYERESYQMEFQRDVNYRTILKLTYEPKKQKIALSFRDQEIFLKLKTKNVLYPIVMFYGDMAKLSIVN